MIRNRNIVATAIRKKSGKIKILRQNVSSLTKKYKILSLPILRGIILLFETMIIGVKSLNLSLVTFNLLEGLLKLFLLSGYIYAISFMPDIKRIFMYHGAEHKAVNCYEKEGKVTLKSAKKYSTIHKRC